MMERHGRPFIFRPSLLAIPFALAGPAFAQSVVPNGTTATSVTTQPSGRINIDLAPVTGAGLSINRYTAFSVPGAGVDLNNRTVGANTIINEVTGSNRSLIAGPVEVLGTRAHVVVVNPNGITVNGGSFINTGGVALSAGTLRYSGVNPVLNTGNGDIEVTGQGLSGTMSSLQLIAAKLRIDGPVRTLDASPNADIALVARHHDVTLDASLIAGSTSRPWASRVALADTSNEILIDVTSRGVLAASRVAVAVSARGAGVAFAGEGQATLGGFTIEANGKVSLNGAAIRAEKAIKLAARSIEILNSPARQSDITSLSSAVTLLARDGDLDVRGSVTGKVRDGADPESLGAVTFGVTGDIRILSESADRLAIAFAANDDLSIQAGGALTNNTGRLLSNAQVIIRAASILNTIDVSGSIDGGRAERRIVHGRRTWQSLWLGRKKTITYSQNFGTARIPGQLAYIVGSSVDISTGNFVNRGEINAQDGSLIISAQDLLNAGNPAGRYAWQRRCGLVCVTTGQSGLSVSGGALNASGGLLLKATGAITNEGGQITAYGNMELEAPRITGRGLFLPTLVTRPGGLATVFSGDVGWMAMQPGGGTYLAPTGSVTIRTSAPVQFEGGEISAAAGIENPAGTLVIAHPVPVSPVANHRIGLFQGLF